MTAPRTPPGAEAPPTAAERPRSFGFLTRRRVLQLGLGASAATLVGGGGLYLLRGSAPAVQGLKRLSAQGYRTLLALAATHIPAGGPFPPGAAAADLARAFDTYLADEPEEHVADVNRALTLVEYGPLLFDHRLRTFCNLQPAEQLTHWMSWGQSESLLRRQIWWGFAKFFGLVFYDTPAVWPHLGYPGPSLQQLGAGGVKP